VAVNGFRTFLLTSPVVLAMVAAASACSSDSKSSDTSDSGTGPSSSTTGSTTTGAGPTNTTGAGPTNTTGAGPTNTTGAGPTNTTGGGGASSGTTQTSAGPTSGSPTTSGGGANTTGTQTTGPLGDCGLTLDSQELAQNLETVGIVTFSAGSTLESAEIKFGPASGDFTMTAPVDVADPTHRTLLLGMKPESDYKFQIAAQAGGQACASDTYTLTTGPASNAVPRITRTVTNAEKASSGFYVTISYSTDNPQAFIFDADGDPVWWSPAPGNASGVRMDYEGKALWMVTGNPTATGNGQVRRVLMDGTGVQNLPSTYDAHHDLAPLPGGSVAALIHANGNCASIIEVHPDMTVTDIVPDVSTIYTPTMQCHPNAILYHPEDDSFTVSDRNPNVYVKIKRDGEVEWQLGGNNPPPQREPAIPQIDESWNVNHGHHLLPNGNFLFFNNNGDSGSANVSHAVEFSLDLTAYTATEVWRYAAENPNRGSGSLGDVQRLPNGNTLITYSNASWIYEVDDGGQIVQTYQSEDPLGYLMHRDSLYGPPPK